MKTLKDHVILYDEECPMCQLYTNAFVKSGMLDQNGRQSFIRMDKKLDDQIDKDRARNEIALVDIQSGKVTYGIDSMFKVIANSFPAAKGLFQFTPFRFVMKKMYSFISYNRKVIIPGRQFEKAGACTPDFHAGYRWAFIVIAWLVASLILNSYSALLMPLIPQGDFQREFLICGGQILFQGAIVYMLRKDRMVHYLGNMMTISFAGSLLLLPGLLISRLGVTEFPLLYGGYFGAVAGLMLLEHMRRVRILEIHWSASLTWVIYRLLVLWMIV